MTELALEARMAMIKNIDREGVFESYKRFHWPVQSTWFPEQIMASSQKDEIRAWACRELIQDYGGQLANSCNPKRSSIKSFEKALSMNGKYWSEATLNLADVKVGKETLKDLVMAHIAQLEQRIKNEQENDPERVRKALELIESIRRGPA